MSEPLHILALARGEWQEARYRRIVEGTSWSMVCDTAWDETALERERPDVVLTLADSQHEIARVALAARARTIPTLLIMDGLLEWRHTFLNPRFSAGGQFPLYQPATCDRIACYGWTSVRTLEAWGNVGRCELVGDPRFDPYLTRSRRKVEGRRRVVVLSANNPGYDDAQSELARRGFDDLERVLVRRSDVEVVWRLRKELARESDGRPLPEVLEEAAACITQPSTVMLEPMLLGVPTAVIDYPRTPQYAHAVWTIQVEAQIEAVIAELLDPPAAHLAYQDQLLHDQLECRTPALPRMRHLIEQLAIRGRSARAAGTALELPPRMVDPGSGGHALPPRGISLADLYPTHPVLAEPDRRRLEIELMGARQELAKLRRELATRRIGYWVSKAATGAYRRWRRSRR